MKIVGIDAGVEGAAALLDTDTDSIVIHDLELLSDRTLDSRWLFDVLLDFEVERLVTERTFKQPKLTAMTAEIVCVGKILQADVRVVAVSTWKKAVLGLNTNDKKVSIDKCLHLRPDVNLRRPRARTDNPDRAEAVLLAIFATDPPRTTNR